jgi:AAA+ ATPase superfamily predicted ATPase
MFIDRENELAFLEKKWEESNAQMIVLWGKRRVGKTELVKQFIENKPHVYFLAESTHEREQLKRFSFALGEFFKESLLATRGFENWEESFRYIKEKNKKFVLVFDEFPYLIQANRGITSIFQHLWDEYLSKSPIFLVLLGSSVAMMETDVLGYKAPLFGRRTGQWKIQPMSFNDMRKFRKSKSFEDQMLHYAVGGGTPAYWLWLSKKNSFYQNLQNHVLKKGEPLYDEVEFILREELREPRYYFALLQAIAQGKRRLSEIVNATAIPQPTANKYLGVLSDLDILERELPVTEDKPLKSKKGFYKIKDEFFQFWFRFVFPKRAALEMDHIDRVIEDIKQGMSDYVSFVYEKVAREIVMNNSALFFDFERLGRWWDRNDEIDIVGLSRESNAILFGEVKWSQRTVGVNIFEELRMKSKKISWGDAKTAIFYVLFSKKGFTDGMIELAKKERVALFRADESIKTYKLLND